MTVLMTFFVDNFWWHFLMAIFDDNFDNWKDSPGDFWHLRHWLLFWQLRTSIHDNLWYLTINCDTGQHSQFLRCFINLEILKHMIKKNDVSQFLGITPPHGDINDSDDITLMYLQQSWYYDKNMFLKNIYFDLAQLMSIE